MIKAHLTKIKLFPGVNREVRVLKIEHNYNKALFISDLHCDDSCKSLSLLFNLALKKGYDALVILGDLFEDFHKRVSVEEVEERVFEMINPKYLSQVVDLIYVLSSASHDPMILCPYVRARNGLRLILSPYPVRLNVSGIKIFATHGEIVISNGALAHAINLMLGKLGVKLATEKITRRFLRLSPSEWLISGHTHIPGIDPSYKVANTGSWKLSWRSGLRYWRPPTFSYIEVKRNNLRLKQYT